MIAESQMKISEDFLLKDIPNSWDIKPLKYLCEIENSGIWGEDEPFKDSIEVKVPTTKHISIYGDIDYENMPLRNILKSDYKKYICKQGDIIIVKASGSATNVITGKCGFVEENDKCSFGNFLLRARPNIHLIDVKFLFYFLISHVTRNRVLKMVSSTTYPNLNINEYISSLVILPNISEQKRISKYLDQKTQQIDELIEKTEKKIELLKEQRTALINHCVTKGLNPDAEMKDSGIEWIGKIPKHWDTKRLCFLFRPTSIKNTCDERNLSVYRDYGVIPTDSRDDNHNVISEDTSNYKLVEIGDFVMNKMKCWMGSLGLSNFRGIVSPSYTVMKPLSSDIREYLHYLLRSKIYIPQYKRLSYGVRIGQWDLRFEDFRELPCIIPPLEEQKRIADYLDQKTQQIDTVVEKEEKRISLLKEYRESLISLTVTGKINITEAMV